MKIIKRSGQETSFDEEKIVNAVKKANKEVNEVSRISDEQIRTLAHGVAEECVRMGRAVNVEEIQDMVEDRLMEIKAFVLAGDFSAVKGPECKPGIRGTDGSSGIAEHTAGNIGKCDGDILRQKGKVVGP